MISAMPAAAGGGVWIRLRLRFGPRLTEWLLGVITLGWGCVVLLPGHLFDQPSYAGFRIVFGSEFSLGLVMAVFGTARLVGLLINGARDLVFALLVLAAGWTLSRWSARWMQRLVGRVSHVDETLKPLLTNAVRYAILAVTVVVVLGQFGVQTASILAVLGTAGLAIALALQGTLSNIAAGILLVLLRPFNVGDTIDADGIAGTVLEIGVFATQLRNAEGVFVFAPNSKLSNARIINYSREPSRLVELNFDVPRTADLGAVRASVLAALRADYVRDKPEPVLLVDTLADTSVTLTARVAVPSRDWSGAKADLQERLKQALDKANNFAPPSE